MRKKLDIDEILNQYLGESSQDKISMETEMLDIEELSEGNLEEFIESLTQKLKNIDLTNVEPKIRILHPIEREMLSVEARNYLSELLKTFVIDGITFEKIINRFYGSVDVTKEEIDLHLKELNITKHRLMN